MFLIKKILIRDNETKLESKFEFDNSLLKTDFDVLKKSIENFFKKDSLLGLDMDVIFQIQSNNEKFLYSDNVYNESIISKYESFKNGDDLFILKTPKGTYLLIDDLHKKISKEEVRDNSIFSKDIFNDVIDKTEKVKIIDFDKEKRKLNISFFDSLENKNILLIDDDMEEIEKNLNWLTYYFYDFDSTNFICKDNMPHVNHPLLFNFEKKEMDNYIISKSFLTFLKKDEHNSVVLKKDNLNLIESHIEEIKSWKDIAPNTLYIGFELDDSSIDFRALSRLNAEIITMKEIEAASNSVDNTSLFEEISTKIKNKDFDILLKNIENYKNEQKNNEKVRLLKKEVEKINESLILLKSENDLLKKENDSFKKWMNNIQYELGLEDVELTKDEIELINEIFKSKNEKMSIEKLFKSFGRDIKKLFRGE